MLWSACMEMCMCVMTTTRCLLICWLSNIISVGRQNIYYCIQNLQIPSGLGTRSLPPQWNVLVCLLSPILIMSQYSS